MDAITQAIEEIYNKHSDIEYKLDEPLKNHTSFKVGGAVRAMFFPSSSTAVTQLIDILSHNNITPFVMGNGSNILASDSEHELVVVNMTKLDGFCKTADTEITAGAGALLSKIAVFARDEGLSGFEFAHGIPGTLGGAVVMNAGAYGGEMKDVIGATTAYNSKSGLYTLTMSEHEFAYRQSKFSGSDDVILSSVISLQKGDKEIISRKMDDLSAQRTEKQPLNLPSAGSTFKRPKEAYAAALVEQSGLKGFAIGGAKVSEKHAGFIVNYNNASFDDVMSVIEYVREAVFKQFGVELELEVKIIR